VLSETQQLSLLADLASYDPASVIANYAKSYPGLAFGAPPADVAAQASAWLAAWDNGLHFAVVADYLDDSVLLESLAKLALGEAVLAELTQDGHQLQGDVDAELAAHNYETHPFPPALTERIRTFLAQFQIFPEDSYIAKAASGSDTAFTLSSLASIMRCLDVLGLATAANVPADRLDATEAILWNELANQLQVNTLAGIEAARRARQEPPTGADPLFVQLDDLVTVENIDSGVCQQQLRGYMAQLLPEQKKAFLARFRAFLLDSSLVETLFDPVDVAYFLDSLTSQSLPGSKQDFVAGLESRVVPDLWPTTQKLMLMIASFY